MGTLPALWPPDRVLEKLTQVLQGQPAKVPDSDPSLAWSQVVLGRCHPVWSLLLTIQQKVLPLTFSVFQSMFFK